MQRPLRRREHHAQGDEKQHHAARNRECRLRDREQPQQLRPCKQKRHQHRVGDEQLPDHHATLPPRFARRQRRQEKRDVPQRVHDQKQKKGGGGGGHAGCSTGKRRRLRNVTVAAKPKPMPASANVEGSGVRATLPDSTSTCASMLPPKYAWAGNSESGGFWNGTHCRPANGASVTVNRSLFTRMDCDIGPRKLEVTVEVCVG